MSNQPNRRYGIPNLEFANLYTEGYRHGPHDSFMTFIYEMNYVSGEGKELFRKDLSIPGTIIDFTPAEYASSKDMNMIVRATFPLKNIVNTEEAEVVLPEEEYGTLVEQESTGFFFIVFQEEGKFSNLEVLDFSGTSDKPKKVYLVSFELSNPEIWTPANPKSNGTRMGGLPLNSDGTPYSGPWPAAEDGQFSFIGQYQLKDGRYIHLFSNDDAENYEYPAGMADDEDPYSVVLVEGNPVPAGIEIQEEGERKNSSPKKAYKPKTPKSVRHYPPIWGQGDETPDDSDYDFLLQYGLSSIYDGETINDEFINEHYLFWNPKTEEAKLIIQSD